MKPSPPALPTLTPLSERVARGELMARPCPSREVLKHVTGRWGVLVLIALEDGVVRFGALRRQVGGVSERMLAQTLQLLEGDGFVRRVAYPVVPPRVEYSLTPLGAEVAERVRGLADWIEANRDRILANWSADALAAFPPETRPSATNPAGDP